MACSRTPGPVCQVENPVDIDEGTLCLAAMPTPGPVQARLAKSACSVHQADIGTYDGLRISPTVTPVAFSAPATQAEATGKEKDDPEIEGLSLSETAKKAAYALRKAYPEVKFTSGLRDKADQARAMAANVVLNRTWIKETYSHSTARDKCQKWVDDNKDKKSKNEISAGLKGVMDGLTDQQLGELSRHLSGDAFDVKPVEKDAEGIKKTIRGLTDQAKKSGNRRARFLEKEGGLVRWHAQF